MFFKKKKPEPVQEIHYKTPCELGNHMWRDFPPYVEYGTNYKGKYYVMLKEHYVCCLCHKIELIDIGGIYYGEKQPDGWPEKQIRELKRENKELDIKPLCVVKDMINDAVRVDREKLRMWDNIHTGIEKEEFEFKLPEENKVEYSITKDEEK